MNTTLPGLVVDVEARIDKLEKGLKRANAVQKRSSTVMERRARVSAARMRDSYGRAGDSILATFKKLGPGIIAGLSVGALAGVTRNLGRIVTETAQIGDEAKRAGVSVRALQEWSFVGKQNRIGIDQIVDGLKELNLRADEFVITGKGPAAEAFARLGFGATELKRKLKDPSALLLEIIGRMEGLDKAAQIRVGDEIFGGSAGERFVELVGRGESALRDTIRAANDTGAVLDSELIEKAQELDRRFAALQTRTGNFFKRFAVGAVDAGVKIATLRVDVDDLFRSYDQARGLLGDGVADALAKDSDGLGENTAAVAQLRREYERLADYANGQSAGLVNASNLLRSYGYGDIATEIFNAATEMRTLSGEMQDGAIDADEFEKRMGEAASTAQTALGEIEAVDKADFSNVITGVGGLITRLGAAATKARELRASLPGATADGGTTETVYSGRGGDPRSMGGGVDGWAVSTATTNAPTTSPRPRLPTVEASFGLPDVPTGGSAGRSQSDFDREIASIAEETAALNLEAQALAASTGAQTSHGDAMEFARTKADLLAAAQRSGMADTPQLRAQIDALASQYVRAGDEAALAAQKIAEVQDASRAGAQGVADVFTQMATGAISAKDAMKQLILQVIALTIKKRILAAVNAMSGFGGLIGGVISLIGGGFAGGGYTGHGGKNEPAGIVHKGEYVLSKTATRNIGVGNLEALHQSARKGYAGGGLVGGAANGNRAPMGRSGASDEAPMTVTINAPVTVNGSAGTPEQNNDLAAKMARQMEGTMRGVVVDELRVRTH
jgi:hypothetical protein